MNALVDTSAFNITETAMLFQGPSRLVVVVVVEIMYTVVI